jgi:hypothetical protein
MRVALGAFACAGIRTHMGGNATVSAAVEKAVFHYTSRLKAGRSLIDVPSLEGLGTKDPELLLDLEVVPEIEELLEREADRQGVSVEDLVAHAVLLYLAELDFLEAQPGP